MVSKDLPTDKTPTMPLQASMILSAEKSETVPNPPLIQDTKRSKTSEDEDDEEFNLDFLDIMDKALSESKLKIDHQFASQFEAPSIKSLISTKDPAQVEVRSSTSPVQDRQILVNQFTNILMLLNNSLESLVADDDLK